MEIKDYEIEELTRLHNNIIEEKIPETIPPLGILSQKRQKRGSLFAKGGSMVFAYMFLILIFTFLSVFIIDSLSELRNNGQVLTINTDIFSTQSSGDIVYAFRETVK